MELREQCDRVCFRYTKGGSLDGRYSGLSPNPHGPGLMAPGLTSLHLGPGWPPSHDGPPHGHQPGPPGCGGHGKGDMIVITSLADCHTGCHTRDSVHRDNHRGLWLVRRISQSYLIG